MLHAAVGEQCPECYGFEFPLFTTKRTVTSHTIRISNNPQTIHILHFFLTSVGLVSACKQMQYVDARHVPRKRKKKSIHSKTNSNCQSTMAIQKITSKNEPLMWMLLLGCDSGDQFQMTRSAILGGSSVFACVCIVRDVIVYGADAIVGHPYACLHSENRPWCECVRVAVVPARTHTPCDTRDLF